MALSPFVPNPRTTILGPWQEPTQKVSPWSGHRDCRGKEGGSGGCRVPPVPQGVLQRARGTGASPGCHTPLNPPDRPVAVSPCSYLLLLLTSPQLDEPSQEKGHNPAAAGAAPHGWVRGAGRKHPPTPRGERPGQAPLSPAVTSEPGGGREIAAGCEGGANGRGGPGRARVNRVGSGTDTRTHGQTPPGGGIQGDTGQRHVPRVYATCHPSRD